MSNEIPEFRVIGESDLFGMYKRTLEQHDRFIRRAQDSLKMNKNKYDIWSEIVRDGTALYGSGGEVGIVNSNVLSLICLHAAAVVHLAEERNIRGV